MKKLLTRGTQQALRFVSRPGLPWPRKKAGHANAMLERLAGVGIDPGALRWLLATLLHTRSVALDPAALRGLFAPPVTGLSLLRAAQDTGFELEPLSLPASELGGQQGPLILLLSGDDQPSTAPQQTCTLALLLAVNGDDACLRFPDSALAQRVPLSSLAASFTGLTLRATRQPSPVSEEDDSVDARSRFGFRWFLPLLSKHRRIWRDVLLGSLAIQMLALAMPLFTQVVIDKVVVHRTQSTLLVLGLGMLLFVLFSAGLSWARQYLVLHTGNRIDASLGAAVFAQLFRLPLRWFEQRATGVVCARLHTVETLREFLAAASVTLVLDLPFLLIFVAIMWWYSATLTLIVLAMLSLVVLISAIVAPMFETQLNHQFLLGARNQAFLTEHVAGIETVKSLQMEAQLRQHYSRQQAEYLAATFRTRQLGNTYQTTASLLEQMTGLLVLIVGAWLAMREPAFTVGMLVAFQMFASRLSQPMMRLVGLWQQFQQAKLSIRRLADVMDVTPETEALSATRNARPQGALQIDKLCFRHGPRQPWLYRDFSMSLRPGELVVVSGPSGCGKSTLAKLLQGFYPLEDGRILIDGVDQRCFASNSLRALFGVVPQETVLFTGTVYDNLRAANPWADFDDMAQACRQAGIHDTIEQLPDGYQTRLGERGTGLSGGQRQRLAIARALLKKPRILVFDEATSALDAQTAGHFAQTVNRLRGKVSILFITHAMPKGLLADRIVTLGTSPAATPAAPAAVEPVSQ